MELFEVWAMAHVSHGHNSLRGDYIGILVEGLLGCAYIYIYIYVYLYMYMYICISTAYMKP